MAMAVYAAKATATAMGITRSRCSSGWVTGSRSAGVGGVVSAWIAMVLPRTTQRRVPCRWGRRGTARDEVVDLCECC